MMTFINSLQHVSFSFPILLKVIILLMMIFTIAVLLHVCFFLQEGNCVSLTSLLGLQDDPLVPDGNLLVQDENGSEDWQNNSLTQKTPEGVIDNRAILKIHTEDGVTVQHCH